MELSPALSTPLRALEYTEDKKVNLLLIVSGSFVGARKAGDPDAAIRDCKRAIKIKPDYASAYYNLGTVYLGIGDPDSAIRYFNRAVELKPDFATAYYNRAVAQYRVHAYDKAWQDVEMCRKLGYQVPASFLNDLRKASGRQE